MKEQPCEFVSGEERLEAKLSQLSGAAGLVICHPHPLFGGTMDNKVVTTVARAAQTLGISTLRFNFRGVGNSTGSHDHGHLEQQDVLAAIEFAQQQGWQQIILAGFSFGAGMACLALNRLTEAQQAVVSSAMLIAPAVHHFDAPNQLPALIDVTVFMGDADEVVPFDEVDHWVQCLMPTPHWVVFEDTSHFFHGRLVDLKESVIETLKGI